MTYVILGTCVNDGACIDACPVDAIHPKPGDPQFLAAHQLYIDPGRCVSCNACAEICPVQAIVRGSTLTAEAARHAAINADFFKPGNQAG